MNLIGGIVIKTKNIIHIFILTVLVLNLLLVYPSINPYNNSVQAASWYNSSWSYCKQITIDHNQVSGSQTNFPILINISSDTSLGSYAQSDGDDILFTDATNVTVYNHEIEYFDESTGRLIAWVNISSLSNTTDTIIYMYYGNAGCASQQNKGKVWDKNRYFSVYHMNDTSGATTSIYDSKQNYTGTKNSSNHPVQTVSGKIGFAQDFNGTGDKISGGDMNLLDDATKVSMSCWYYADTMRSDDVWYTLMGKWIGTNSLNKIAFQFHGSDDRICMWIADGSNSYGYQTGRSEVEAGRWHYLSGVYNGTATGNSNRMQLYVDGHPLSLSFSGTIPADTDNNAESFLMGYRDAYTGYCMWDGKIDEIRLGNTVLSAGWIKTEYNNMNNASNGGFYSIGMERSYGIKNLAAVYYNATSINLSWSRNLTTTSVLVFKTSGYPADHTDGTEIYNGSGSSYNHTGLFSCKKYYYKVFSFYDHSFSTTTSQDDNTTPPGPPTGAGFVSTSGNSINISWTNGSNTTTTRICYSTVSQPLTPSSGTGIYNGTFPYSIQSVASSFYMTLFTYNSTVNLFSSGVYLNSYLVYISCYDERNGTSLSNYTVFFSNPSGSSFYSHFCNTSTIIVPVGSVPVGNNISLIVNRTGYSNRTYVFDIALTGNYIIKAYLSVNTSSSLYLLSVVNENNLAISNAKMIVSTFVNSSVGFENVSILYTDGAGQATVFLEPYRLYKFLLNKSGYKNETSDWIPSTQLYTHTFKMNYVDMSIPPNYVLPVFTAVRGGTTLFVNYTDSMLNTTNTKLVVYYSGNFNSSETVAATYSLSGSNSFAYTLIGVNVSGTYRCMLFLNHSLFGYILLERIVYGNRSTITNQSRFELLFTLNYGTCPFGWSNMVMWFIMLGCLFSFGRRETYMSAILCGFIFLFINYKIGFYTGMAAGAGIGLPVLFIIIGILMIYRDRSVLG